MVNDEIKINNRFTVQFPLEMGLSSSSVLSITKPEFINGEWNLIQIRFADTIENSPTDIFWKVLKNDLPFTELIIETYNAEGNTVDIWKVLVDKVMSVHFGRLNVSDEIDSDVSVTFKPKDCLLTKCQ